MKTSMCITVFNEEGSVGRLLESLVSQTKRPDEIVIVDGGSSDGTLSVISDYKSKLSSKNIKLKVLIEKGASIARGRNVSIKNASNKIIAHIDAGCVAKRDWLEKITKPFNNKDVGLVAGFYDMLASNAIQKAMNVFHGVMPEQFDSNNFIPSARSVAFRKKVWEEIGGYSEKLERAGEDTLFFYELVKQNVKIVRVKEARVVWEESANLGLIQSIKKFFAYAKGDAQIGIWWHPSKQLASHNIKISLIFIRYLFGFILLIFCVFYPPLLFLPILLVFLYINWSFRKVYLLTNDWKAGLWGIVIQFASDFAVMAGFMIGFLNL